MEREPFLQRARACSRLTLPYLIPPDGMARGQRLPSPHHSVGAAGVSNLASKLLLSMLPPNEPCFRLQFDNLQLEREQEQADPDFMAKLDKALSRIERAVLADVEARGDRPVVYEGNLHLLVGGNVLYHDTGSGLRLLPLSRYVLERDPEGRVLEIVVKEELSPRTLPESLRERLREMKAGDSAGEQTDRHREDAGEDEDPIDLYTRIRRLDDRRWEVEQECYGEVVEGTRGTYTDDRLPWMPVRMYRVAGENYGRSYVEQFLGDLHSLDVLMRALLDASALAARVVYLVRPNSFVNVDKLTAAPNGAVIQGNAEDITTLQLQKSADLQVTLQEIQGLENRLRTAFLMMEGARRDAERVTAEEIRLIAQELESGLGGVYTVISREFQLPYIRQKMKALAASGKLPDLPDGLVAPSIVTGFEALGRGNDRQKLMEFLGLLGQTFGGEALRYINPSSAISRLAASMGITTEGLVKDEQTLAAEAQQAQQEQQQMLMQQQAGDMLSAAAPQIAQQLGNALGGGNDAGSI